MNGETLNCTVSAGTLALASHTANGLMSSADKIKLDNVNNNAQENVVERISLDGTVQTVTNKTAVMNLSAYAKKSDVASGMKVKGSVNSYADLPANAEAGDLYNIKTAGGVDGEGVSIQAGDNVIRTANGTWDVLAGMTDFSNFVEKENGKGLSTNDFTTAEKTKLASLNNYTLPTASETEKGGFIVGSGLSMVGDVLNVTLTGGGGGSDYQPFTGATPALDGAEGLVPAPAVKDRLKFLRGDGTWAHTNEDLVIVVSPGDSVNSVVLGSPVATIQGGLWQEMINGFPALKLRHGDYEYNYYYDTMRQVSIADSPLNTTLKGQEYVLDQLPSTLDGGLWYEVADNKPTLMLHRGSYDYGYNYDTITYKGSNANLYSYMPFESTTADALANMGWKVDSTATVTDTPNGGKALKNTGTITFGKSFGKTTAWTIDFWVSFENPDSYPKPTKATTYNLFDLQYHEGSYAGAHIKILVETNAGTTTTTPRLIVHTDMPPNSTKRNVYPEVSLHERIHCAIVHPASSRMKVYINGKSHTPTNTTLNYIEKITLFNGAGTNGPVMYIDHFRLFKGQVVWDGDFTPPTSDAYL